jgi:hypothetical protein
MRPFTREARAGQQKCATKTSLHDGASTDRRQNLNLARLAHRLAKAEPRELIVHRHRDSGPKPPRDTEPVLDAGTCPVKRLNYLADVRAGHIDLLPPAGKVSQKRRNPHGGHE